jgi:hypothetical protein
LNRDDQKNICRIALVKGSTVCLLSLILVYVAGCNVLGAVLGSTAPEPTTPPKYVPTTEPMVVIAENWHNPAGNDVDAEQLARFVSDDLIENSIGKQIDPTKVIDLKSRDPDGFHSLSIARIGQIVGATQVLYINITDSSLVGPEGGDSLRGRCTARVKIVDVEHGDARWPLDAHDGYPISVQTDPTPIHSDADEIALRQTLQQKAAERIAGLFYASPAPKGEQEELP